jgi:hypothetical protein
VPLFLEEIEAENPSASVSVYVFNPANLLMSLYPITWAGDFSKCPRLEILVEDDTRKRVRVLVSLLAWNGKPVERTPEHIVKRIYGSVIKWMAAQHFHETHTCEPKMLAAHNLIAPLVEFTYAENKAPSGDQLVKDRSRLSRKPFDVNAVKDLAEFSAANRNYLDALKAFLESQIFALPGSELMQNLNTANE